MQNIVLPPADSVITAAPYGHIGHTVHIYDVLESTNTTLYSSTSKSTPSHGTAIVAQYQAAGKGQIGSYWHSKASKNLLNSILLRPEALHAEKQYLLNIVVSLAVSDHLLNLGLEDVHIKWPNDIYIGDKKIAGVLTQCSLLGQHVQYAIVGVGLNVNQIEWPEELPNPTSIASEIGGAYDLIEVAIGLYQYLQVRYQQLQDLGILIDDYLARLYQLDQSANYEVGGVQKKGSITGISDRGELLIEWHDGQIQSFRHGQIRYLGMTNG